MPQIFYMIGPSSSGKDTIYKRILAEESLHLHTVTMYTTRPIRKGEYEGVEYRFTNYDQLQRLKQQGQIIEMRSYETIHGQWDYFTVDDGTIDLASRDYCMIGVVDSFLKMREYFGIEKVIPIYIQVEDGVRLQRALDREKNQEIPKYKELCRRYLADMEDFSEEKLRKANIVRRFENNQLESCIKEIISYVKQQQMR